jgi:hypothetical protein
MPSIEVQREKRQSPYQTKKFYSNAFLEDRTLATKQTLGIVLKKGNAYKQNTFGQRRDPPFPVVELFP